MTIIHPLLASRSAPNYRQSWRLAGVWRRAINLMTESGELLTLHRQGSGFGPGGWMLRRAQFDALCGGLCGNERPQVVAQGIRCLLSYASFVTVFRPRSMALRPTGGTGWVKAPD